MVILHRLPRPLGLALLEAIRVKQRARRAFPREGLGANLHVVRQGLVAVCPVVPARHINHLLDGHDDDDARGGDGDLAPFLHLLGCVGREGESGERVCYFDASLLKLSLPELRVFGSLRCANKAKQNTHISLSFFPPTPFPRPLPLFRRALTTMVAVGGSETTDVPGHGRHAAESAGQCRGLCRTWYRAWGVWNKRGHVAQGSLTRHACIKGEGETRGEEGLALLPNARTMILPVAAGEDEAASLACGVSNVVVVVVRRGDASNTWEGRARRRREAWQAVVLRGF